MEQDGEWEIGEEEVRLVLGLPAEDRYRWFLQIACDWEEVWGLSQTDGWVLASDRSQGERGDAFPLWPHPALARLCAQGEWDGAAPGAIPLDELIEDLLPLLEEDGRQVAVFPTPEGDGVIVTPGELRRDLETELDLGT
ncbi:MAG TPA: DUF2750 domain-containing protein [Thermoanaerobaculia bacterium]|nr:DUF2750 domain-containing protein [Thermoanaerobaculia bacterium]